MYYYYCCFKQSNNPAKVVYGASPNFITSTVILQGKQQYREYWEKKSKNKKPLKNHKSTRRNKVVKCIVLKYNPKR